MVIAVAEEIRNHSASVADQCAERGLPCVDVAPDFGAAMHEAEELLGLA